MVLNNRFGGFRLDCLVRFLRSLSPLTFSSRVLSVVNRYDRNFPRHLESWDFYLDIISCVGFCCSVLSCSGLSCPILLDSGSVKGTAVGWSVSKLLYCLGQALVVKFVLKLGPCPS